MEWEPKKAVRSTALQNAAAPHNRLTKNRPVSQPYFATWPSAVQSQRPQLPGLPEQLGGAGSGSPPVAAKTDNSFFIRREPQ